MTAPRTPEEHDLVNAYVWCGMASISDEWQDARTQEARRAINQIKAKVLRDAADDLEAQLGDSGPGNRNTGYGRAGLDLIRQLRHRATTEETR